MTEEEKKAADAKASADAAEAEAKSKAEAEAKAKAEADAKAQEDRKEISKKERLLYAKNKIEKQLSELDGDEPEDEDTPVTVGMLDAIEKKKSQKTALAMAESIEDENERERAKDILKHRILPSGNAEEDLKLARAAVNAERNAQIAEEAARKGKGKSFASSSGAPAKKEPAFQATAEESVFMRPPYNLTKEQIIAAREKAESQA